MTTVYTLNGAFSGLNNYLPQQLQGQITNGNTVIQVPYNNFGLFVNTVQAGAALLDTYLSSTLGPMVVFGHSLGAVVASYWLNQYAPDSPVTPARLSFVLIGNSVRPYGGALGAETGAWIQNWFGNNVTAPANTPYTVLDIARQYDGWADWPTGTFNIEAEFNAFAGQALIHPHYENVNPSPTAPGNVSFTPLVSGSPGNITYMWSETMPLPIFGTTWNALIEIADAATRPTVESAYSRPVTILNPDLPVVVTAPVMTVRVSIPPTFQIDVPPIMAVGVTMLVPTVGPFVAAPVMAVTAVLHVPTLIQGATTVPTLQVVATIPAPVVSFPLHVNPPVMTATATAVVPLPVFGIEIVAPPAMAVTATVPAPVIAFVIVA